MNIGSCVEIGTHNTVHNNIRENRFLFQRQKIMSLHFQLNNRV